MKKPAHRGLEIGATILFFTLVCGIWELGYQRRWWPPYLFPGPWEILRTMGEGLQDGSLLLATQISLTRMGIAFFIALGVGSVLGMLCGTLWFFRRTIGILTLGFQTLPSICWLPLAVVWFGLSEQAILFVTLMGALLAVTIAVADGVQNIPPLYLNAARTLGARGFRLYREVLLPAALPAILSGAKQGWAFAWRSLMAGELLSVSKGALGLGQTLNYGRDLNDMSLVLAVMMILVFIGIVADQLCFGRLEQSVRRRWGLTSS